MTQASEQAALFPGCHDCCCKCAKPHQVPATACLLTCQCRQTAYNPACLPNTEAASRSTDWLSQRACDWQATACLPTMPLWLATTQDCTALAHHEAHELCRLHFACKLQLPGSPCCRLPCRPAHLVCTPPYAAARHAASQSCPNQQHSRHSHSMPCHKLLPPPCRPTVHPVVLWSCSPHQRIHTAVVRGRPADQPQIACQLRQWRPWWGIPDHVCIQPSMPATELLHAWFASPCSPPGPGNSAPRWPCTPLAPCTTQSPAAGCGAAPCCTSGGPGGKGRLPECRGPAGAVSRVVFSLDTCASAPVYGNRHTGEL